MTFLPSKCHIFSNLSLENPRTLDKILTNPHHTKFFEGSKFKEKNGSRTKKNLRQNLFFDQMTGQTDRDRAMERCFGLITPTNDR